MMIYIFIYLFRNIIIFISVHILWGLSHNLYKGFNIMNKRELNNWFDNIIKLHNINLDDSFEYKGLETLNIIDIASIIIMIKETDTFSKLQIKDKMIKLDKDNLLKFLKHLGKYLAI